MIIIKLPFNNKKRIKYLATTKTSNTITTTTTTTTSTASTSTIRIERPLELNLLLGNLRNG